MRTSENKSQHAYNISAASVAGCCKLSLDIFVPLFWTAARRRGEPGLMSLYHTTVCLLLYIFIRLECRPLCRQH
ncbi:unnamed protein product [Spodoptera littoralis]|uniref:Uncharacterized protein n=1 Tax=Spodoptera littoralis TaxID=7109 RepID=A0A9P0IEA7_SPOLI|nr:unnamed protein product [Spodoptera littoralis]CAH1645236.1 unnamed protein product [Spodoptera littoralis]